MRKASRKRALPAIAAVLLSVGVSLGAAHAQFVTLTPPNIPIAFGMTPEQVSLTLGVPLWSVRVRHGDELLLAIDCGTQSVRALLVDLAGEIVAMRSPTTRCSRS